ncbi:MAG: chromosome segregation protein SMC [Desulfobacterales bacterium]
MKLKKLEICGFKSFYDRVSIEFPPGITAIVGPNGCGKSNLVDAIRWVMGEQSVKQLRGKAMEDVIFAGSNGRPPLGMAEVTLTLINDNGSVPEELKDFTEIEVTRRLYRSGESAYFINRRPCRLKDIHHLFLGSGVGTRSYSVIQQGNIGAFTEAGPEERRTFIEEAAGITRYKQHKAEALRKIEATRQNLLRVADILLELERQMGSLKRQARKAELYNRTQARIRSLDVRLASLRREELKARMAEAERLLAELRDADLAQAAELRRLDAAVEEIQFERLRKNQAIGERKEKRFELQRDADRLEADRRHRREELERLGREIRELEAARAELAEKDRRLEGEIEREEGLGENLRRELEVLRARLEEERGREEALAREFEERSRRVEELRREHLELVNREARLRNLHQSASQNRESLKRRQLRAEEEEAKVRSELAQAGERERRATARLEAARRAIADHSAAAAELRTRLEEKSRELGARVKQVQGLEFERNGLRSKHAALKKMEESFEWYREGVRAVMKRAQAASTGGVVGLVADLFEPEESLTLAVEAALGESLQYVLVAGQEQALEAIEHLRRGNAGRCGFVPVAALHETSPPAGETEPEGLLLQRVRVKPGFEAVARALLGNVVLVASIEEAVARFNENGRVRTFVTPQGDLLSPRGFLIGGSREAAGGILAKKQEIRELEREIRALDESIAAHRRKLQELEAEVRRLDVDLQRRIEAKQAAREEEIDAEKAQYKASEDKRNLERRLEVARLEQEQLSGEAGDLDDEIQRADRALAELAAAIAAAGEAAAAGAREIAELGARRERFAQGLVQTKMERSALQARLENHVTGIRRLREFQADGRRRLAELTADIERRMGRIESLRGEIAAIEETLQARHAALAALEAELSREEEEYAAIDARLRESDQAIAGLKDRREKTLERLRLLELEQAERRLRCEHLAAQIEDRYRTPFAELCAALEPAPEPAPSPEELEAELARLQAQLSRIGEVNLGAIREFQELAARHEFLNTQKQDLEKAIEDLQRVIRKINTVSQERFLATFAAINEKLREVFPRLFNGGSAELVLTRPDDPLETGVEYMIHPPGKKLTRMSLLSGGEKALAAIAFLFAIFLIRPTAFCLLDEIDAPLDESNVYRFNELLGHIGETSQILMITHNKRSMEFADMLFGITMEQKGVSSVVSVSLRRPESQAA